MKASHIGRNKLTKVTRRHHCWDNFMQFQLLFIQINCEPYCNIMGIIFIRFGNRALYNNSIWIYFITYANRIIIPKAILARNTRRSSFLLVSDWIILEFHFVFLLRIEFESPYREKQTRVLRLTMGTNILLEDTPHDDSLRVQRMYVPYSC